MRLLDDYEMLLVTGGSDAQGGGEGDGDGEGGGEEESNPDGCTVTTRTGDDGIAETVLSCPRQDDSQ